MHSTRNACFIGGGIGSLAGAASELLQELCGHLRLDLQTVATANCIPCCMPYITSMFMPREAAQWRCTSCWASRCRSRR
jgi:myosin-crossreactive antigen